MAEIKKVKPSGGPDKTVTWIWLDPETGGRLKVEYYDFSETAQKLFGNDIAYTITVNEMNKLFSTVNQNQTSIRASMDARRQPRLLDVRRRRSEQRVDRAERWAWSGGGADELCRRSDN